MSPRHLFERFPRAADAIPWVELATLPTPIEQHRIGGVDAWVKRDDLTGSPYGGNKVRKLEFLLAAATQKGATRVITAGAFGSHHALATTVYAKQLGLDVTVIMFPQFITPHVREILLMCAGLGADIQFTRRMEGVPFALWRAKQQMGDTAIVIPPGGSDAIGTLGYVEAGLEMAAQWQRTTAPAKLHVAAGTLGTVAGLAIGFALANADTRIIASRITSRLVTNERHLHALMRGTLQLLVPHARSAIPGVGEVASRVELNHEQVGDGYGRETPQGAAALRLFGDAGLALDATYTAKAAAAFLADPLTKEGSTIFLHTLSAAEPQSALRDARTDRLPEQIAARVSHSLAAPQH